jgi:pyrroline-5-carboxylate reductase
MKTISLGFIGGGHFTKIFLQSIVNKKIIFKSISLFDSDRAVLNEFKLKYPFIRNLNSVAEVACNDIIFLAVQAPDVIETLKTIKNELTPQSVVISLAPQVTIAQMAEEISGSQVVRLVPNATSIVNLGYNPICFAPDMSEIQKWGVLEMLNLLGYTFETSEEKLEGYALLSAMLPTYFWFQWHELENIGTQFGLSVAECRESIFETLNAALFIMYRSGMDPEAIMELIPSKPIADKEEEIKSIYREKLMEMWKKIKP